MQNSQESRTKETLYPELSYQFCKFFNHAFFIEYLRVTASAFIGKHFCISFFFLHLHLRLHLHLLIFTKKLVRKHWVKYARILRFSLTRIFLYKDWIVGKIWFKQCSKFKSGFLESNFQLLKKVFIFIYGIKTCIQIICIKFPLNLFDKIWINLTKFL